MDSIDKAIIATLQKNGRTSNEELARLSHVAQSTMIQRVRRLEKQGVIKGYRAVLDPAALGYNVQAIVMIALKHRQLDIVDAIERRLKAIPEVKACFLLAGVYDFMVHVVARDIEQLARLIKYKFYEVGNIRCRDTFLVLSPPQEKAGYSLEYVEDDGD